MLYNSLVKNSAMIMQMNMKTLILYKLFMVTIHSFTDINCSQQSCLILCKQRKSISNGNNARDNTVLSRNYYLINAALSK